MDRKQEILKANGVNFDGLQYIGPADAFLKSMDDFAEEQSDLIHDLFNKTAEELKPLEDLWRQENSPDKFIIPDRTKFYIWIRNKLLPEMDLRPSFYYMHDNHTFTPITGKDIHDIKNNAIELAKKSPYGMICPVNIMQNDKELRQIGPAAHVDGNGVVDIEGWFTEIMKEECVRNYKG